MVTEAAPHAIEQDLARDHVEALRTLHRVRSLLFFLLVLALLMPFVVYALIRMGMVDPAAPDATWYRFSTIGMTLGSFWSLFAGALLVVTYYLSINVCLVGRLGSAGQPIVGLMWMVVLMLLLVEWPGRDHIHLPGVFFDIAGLLGSPPESDGGWQASIMHGARFLILPLVSLVASVAADMRYGRGYQLAMRRVKQKLGVTVHS